MKTTNFKVVGDNYGLFFKIQDVSSKYLDLIRLKSVTLFIGIISYLKKLWTGYLDRQRYRKEVQRRLLKQRALKRERASTPLSLTGEHWTDRLLKIGRKEQGTRSKEVWIADGLLTNRSPRRPNPVANALLLAMTRCDGFGWNLRQWASTPLSLTMVVLLMCCAAKLKAQDTIKPLKVGDQIPELVLAHSINSNTSSINLKDYRGKLLILDFWATWCSPCVKMLPQLDSLQEQFKDQVQFITVAYQSRAVVDKFNAQMLKMGRGNKGLGLTDDVILSAYFPHSYLPTEVWISPTGKVIAITDEKALSAENLQKALVNEFTAKVERIVFIPYDSEKPLFNANNGGNGHDISYYKVFGQYVKNLPSKAITWSKPDGSVQISAINTSLSRLYQQAYSYNKIEMISRNRLLLLVKDSSQFLPPAPRGPVFLEWAITHRYNYELRTPAGFKEKAFEEMQRDLAVLFPQYQVGIEKMERPCWVLQRISSLDKLATKGGPEVRDFNPLHFEIQNQPLRQLVGMLDIKFLSLQPFPVLDETHYEGKVDLLLDANMSKVAAINEALKAYDLTLEKGIRSIDMLVIRDQTNYKPNTNQKP
nr:TlpA family protein disulfide reductase [Pseudopedobacter sp.]